MAQWTWLPIVVVTASLAVVAVSSSSPRYELREEWNLWKSKHGKSYESEHVELERHLVWLSNKEYIDQHNANSDIFGFTLAMNHHGDLVSACLA
jgi:cathepsin L